MTTLYPNVPFAEGVPAVLRSDRFPADTTTQPALTNKTSGKDKPAPWGLYTVGGTLYTQVDSVLAFEAALEAVVSDYPVEQGGFASYNKVIRPYEVRLMLARGGTVQDRNDFLTAIQAAWKSTDLYDVYTPEMIYRNVNVVNVRRTATADAGVSLLRLEVTLRAIRQTASLVFSNTQEAASADETNDGAVQTSDEAEAQKYDGAADVQAAEAAG